MAPNRQMETVPVISPVAQGFSLYMYIKIRLHVYIKKVMFTDVCVLETSIFGDEIASFLVPQGL